jgi:hypothetical protein
MSNLRESTQIIFNPKYAWNLVEGAVQDGVIPAYEKGSSVEGKVLFGKKSGWINQSNIIKSYQMFVFAGEVFFPDPVFDANPKPLVSLKEAESDPKFKEFCDTLPNWGKLDFTISQKLISYNTHINLHKPRGLLLGSLKDQGLIKCSNDIPEGRVASLHRDTIISFKPYILKSLHSRGSKISNADFNRAMEEWYDHDYNETKSAIFLECGYLVESLLLSQYGFSNYSDVPTTKPDDVSPEDVEISKATKEVISIYFNNSLVCPSPRSLRDAIQLKENKLIGEWRQKVLAWTEDLSNGKLDAKEIKKEIEESNLFFKRVEFFTEQIPRLSLLLVAPIGIASFFYPILHELSVILEASAGAAHIGGFIADKILLSSDRKNYRWMISNSR